MGTKIVTAILNFIAVLFILFVLSVIFFGCNPESKIQRAEQRVITNPKALRNVGLIWLSFNPCLTDTDTEYIQGTNTITEVPVIDSFAQYLAIRELQDRYMKECNAAIKVAYDSGIAQSERIFIKIPIKVRVDTFKIRLLDRQIIKLLQDSLTKAEKRIERTEQSELDFSILSKQYKKERDRWLWYLIASIAALVGSNALWLKTKIRL